MRRPWTVDALCTQVSWTFFFASKENDEGLVDLARGTCRMCPVQRECLDYAVASEWGERVKARWGIWGGVGPAARVRREAQLRAEGRRPEGAREPWERRRDLAVAHGEAFDVDDEAIGDVVGDEGSDDDSYGNDVDGVEGENAA